uniref:Tlr 6Fp protein n=1 Tax=Tetrahymena thermophila TaxID=5911 RepID=Q8WRB2_TETTH|nr:Tlr 6Fp protein [Tetrahymena thermophila]
MYFFRIGPSEKDNKKVKVVIFDEKKKRKKTLHIGQVGYQDYLQHKDEERKQRYIERHQAREDWKDVLSAGFWSRYLLWNKKTIQESIEDIEKRFDLKRIPSQY